MKLIDSHTHLYFAEDFPDQEAVVKRALDAGVEHMVLPGVNSSTIAPIKKLHAMFPEHTSMTIGLHPSDVAKDTFGEELAIIESELNVSSQEYVAIGEIGVDLHWETHNIDLQQQAFECQLNFAKEFKLPVVIHSRDAFEQTHEVLKGIYALTPIVFHSYSGDIAETERILSLYENVYFGINGIVTFKNAKIKEVLDVIPQERLLLETDAPYLSPVPHRGKTNESAFLVHTAAYVADYLGRPLDEIADQTTSNAIRFFGLK